MTYILGGLFVLALLYGASRWFVRADPAQVVGGLRIAAIILIVAGVIAMAFVGRIGLIMVPIGLLMLLLRGFKRGKWGTTGPARTEQSPAETRTSSVDTEYFAMTLDHESGALDGTVRKGAQRGRRLSTLDLPALLGLLAECSADSASQQVLTSFLDRHHPGWREASAPPGADAHAANANDAPAALTRAEAFRILGVDPDADEAAIRDAHRRLMMKFHPDQGGSAWFAARINEARDLLIGH